MVVLSIQNSKDVSTRDSVTIASDQAPIAPMAIIEINVATPIARPANCQVSNAKIIMATGAGSEEIVQTRSE